MFGSLGAVLGPGGALAGFSVGFSLGVTLSQDFKAQGIVSSIIALLLSFYLWRQKLVFQNSEWFYYRPFKSTSVVSQPVKLVSQTRYRYSLQSTVCAEKSVKIDFLAEPGLSSNALQLIDGSDMMQE